MLLFHVDLGGEGAPPLVILHGLLGSSRNWMSAGRDLATRFHVFALDLRNHGRSPHAPDQTYELMASDAIEWLDAQGLSDVHLLGHSLGGKVVMQLACRWPERTRSATIVDIAPRAYRVERSAFDALLRLDLGRLRTRAEADAALRCEIRDRGMRLFLLSNLVRGDDERLAWQVNLPVLADSLPALRSAPLGPGERYLGRTLFVAGGRSPFIRHEDQERIRAHFPAAEIATLPEADHYPHVGTRAALVETVTRFLLQGA